MKYFVILSAMFAVLLGGCSQEKGDNPTPVSKTKIPLRVTTEDMTDMSDLMGMPGASGSSGGYKTITFTFETGYSVKFTLIGDPNFDGYTGLNVVVPGGTYAPSAAGNNNGGGNNGGGDAACALAAHCRYLQII